MARRSFSSSAFKWRRRKITEDHEQTFSNYFSQSFLPFLGLLLTRDAPCKMLVSIFKLFIEKRVRHIPGDLVSLDDPNSCVEILFVRTGLRTFGTRETMGTDWSFFFTEILDKIVLDEIKGQLESRQKCNKIAISLGRLRIILKQT